MMRLNRFLASCGLGSRRNCESLIQAGKVTVNGIIVHSLSTIVDERNSLVTVDGKRISPPDQFSYILLNKPKGYVTTASDELGRKTVFDLLPHSVRVFPVGRLDKNTGGVLLFTNDGELAHQLLHPKAEIDKIYQVTLNKPISARDICRLQSGVLLDNRITSPCRVKVTSEDRKIIKVVLHEGRKRQIRRMLQALGYKVLVLIRTKFATLSLMNLKPGKWRYLTEKEVLALKAQVQRSVWMRTKVTL